MKRIISLILVLSALFAMQTGSAACAPDAYRYVDQVLNYDRNNRDYADAFRTFQLTLKEGRDRNAYDAILQAYYRIGDKTAISVLGNCRDEVMQYMHNQGY